MHYTSQPLLVATRGLGYTGVYWGILGAGVYCVLQVRRNTQNWYNRFKIQDPRFKIQDSRFLHDYYSCVAWKRMKLHYFGTPRVPYL